MSDPSSRRWSAFCVSPPSAAVTSVAAEGREAEALVELAPQRLRDRRQLLGRLGRCRPDVISQLAGAVGRLALLGQPARQIGRPERPIVQGVRRARRPEAG